MPGSSRARRPLGAGALAARERELEQEELLEREPMAGVVGILGTVREVRRGERGRALGEPLRRAQAPRQRLDDVARCGRSASQVRLRSRSGVMPWLAG